MHPSGDAHVLLTVLGIKAQEAEYALGERRFRAKLAPIALYELLTPEERPSVVLALCTPQADAQTWPILEAELAGRVSLEKVQVSDGATQGDMEAFLRAIVEAASKFQGAKLTVDVTHGFRHFSFLMYVAALYLAALKTVRIHRAVYGLLQQTEGPSPFLDLAPLLEFPLWVHAIQVLGETGSAVPIANLMESRCSPKSEEAQAIVAGLHEVSHAYTSGLPLELGFAAHTLQAREAAIARLLEQDCRLPLAGALTQQLLDPLRRFALAPGPNSRNPKRGLNLDEAELRRQARLVDELLERGNLAVALGLMLEWILSWLILRSDDAHLREHWLNYHAARKQIVEAIEGSETSSDEAPAQVRKASDVPAQLKQRIRLVLQEEAIPWKKLKELRNTYHHHGMREENLSLGDAKTREQLQEVRTSWKKLRSELDSESAG